MSSSGDSTSLPILRKLPMEIILPLIGFVVPFCISGPQLVTGSFVNMLLVTYAVTTRRKFDVFMCVLPSVGAIGNGILFGTLTPYLLYFLPFIWISNMLYIRAIATWRSYDMPFRVMGAATMKSGVLLLSSTVLVGLHVVPRAFILGMGIIQFVTALTGGFLALGLLRMSRYTHA